MPIKGLSEARRLPRLGKIRLGIRVKKKGGGNDPRCKHESKEEMCRYCSYPREVDYFVVPKEVERVTGPKPKEIDVYLPVDQVERVFPQRLVWYAANGRVRCAGDGEFAMRNYKDVPPAERKNYPEAEDGDLIDDFPCPCPLLESGECSRNATLNVILPSVSLGGVYQIVTGSAFSIIGINSAIDYTHSLFADRAGGAAMIPLKLSRVPQNIIYEDKASTHYILNLEFRGGPEERNNILESKRMLMPVKLQLPPPMKPEPGMAADDVNGKPDPNDDVPDFKTKIETVRNENLGDLTGTKFGEKLNEFKQRQAASAETAAIPEAVALILDEIRAADPDKAEEVFNKHNAVINSWATRFKLLAMEARDARKKGLAEKSVEKREALIKEIYLFTTIEQCNALEKDKKRVEGMDVADRLKVSGILAGRRKEIEGEEKSRKEEGRLI